MLAVAALVGVSGAPVGAQEHERDRDRAQDEPHEVYGGKDRVQEEMRLQTGLSQGEWEQVDEEVGAYLRKGGDPNQVRQMVRDAQAVGCQGECLEECFRQMNRARGEGFSGPQAQKMVAAEIQAQVRERKEQGKDPDDEELAGQLRKRMENTFRYQKQQMERWAPSGSRKGPSSPGTKPQGGSYQGGGAQSGSGKNR